VTHDFVIFVVIFELYVASALVTFVISCLCHFPEGVRGL